MPTGGARARVAEAPVPWVLSVVVLALATLLAVVVPAGVTATADDTVRAAVADAGPAADTVVSAPFRDDPADPGRRDADSAADTVALAAGLPAALPPELTDVLAAPVALVQTRQTVLTLPVDTAVQLGPTALRLDWVHRAGGAEVTWTAGSAPGAAGTGGAGDVQAGLSTAVAAALGVAPGDVLSGQGSAGPAVEVLVTGVFTVVDPGDRAWSGVPELLAPSRSGSGSDVRTDVAALLSDTSLPDARLPVLDPFRTFVLAARPAGLTAATADGVERAVAALRAAPVELGIAPLPTVDSGLGTVLDAAADRLAAARAQAAVLVTAGAVGTALVLVLAAAVLVDRRRAVLATARTRGGSLPGLAVAVLAEAAVLTLVGVAAGLLAGWCLDRWWLDAAVPPTGTVLAGAGPAALTALLALPVLAVRAADRATGGTRAPLDRRGRARAGRERAVRRWVADGALVLLAAGAVAALTARGLAGGGPLVVAAPALAVLAGAVLVARLQPALARALLRPAVRARGAVPVLAAAGARSRAVLGPVSLAAVSALGALCLTLAATTTGGQVVASWVGTGADAAVTADPLPAGLPTAGSPGIDLAVPARVTDGVQLSTPAGSGRTRVVVVDPTAYGRLVASTPLPDVDGLDLLGPADGDRVPALVTPDVGAPVGSVLLAGTTVPITVVGTLPPGSTTVLLAADAVPADLAAPDTLWLTGPGAARAAREVPDASVQLRADRLAQLQGAPLTRGLTGLASGTAALLAGLLVLAVVLAGAAGARRRRATSGVLRTLGLGERQARSVTLLELLPGVLTTVLPGLALGVLVAGLVVGPLELALLTGSSATPALVVPWQLVGVLVPALLAVVALVVVEARARRRVPLAEVLREV